jgi:hypothetical protein
MSGQGPEVTMTHHRPSRTGVEIGLVLSVVGMLLGLAFNAGIQYAHINNLEMRTGALEGEYSTMHDGQADEKRETQVTLAKIQTTLSQMQATQAEIRKAVKGARP